MKQIDLACGCSIFEPSDGSIRRWAECVEAQQLARGLTRIAEQWRDRFDFDERDWLSFTELRDSYHRHFSMGVPV